MQPDGLAQWKIPCTGILFVYSAMLDVLSCLQVILRGLANPNITLPRSYIVGTHTYMNDLAFNTEF